MSKASDKGRVTPLRALLLLLLFWALGAAGLTMTGILIRVNAPIAQGVAAISVIVGWQFLRSQREPLPVDVRSLTLFQSWRLVPAIGFLIAAHSGALPREFALEAGIGDLIISVSAFWIARITSRKPRLAAAWQYAGILDLVVVLTIAAAFTHAGDARMLQLKVLPLAMLPLFLVPLSILVHIAAIRKLRGSEQVRGEGLR